MTYEEFEWHILRLVYEDGVDRLQPAYLAYALGLPHEIVTTYLEHAIQAGLVEMDIGEEGHLDYKIPGVDRERPLPAPVWMKADKARSVGDPLDGHVGEGGPRFTDSQLPAPLRAHIEQRYAGADGSIFDKQRAASVLEFGVPLEATSSQALTRRNQNNQLFRIEPGDDSFCDPSQTVFMRQLKVHGVQSEHQLREHVQRLFESLGYRVVQAQDERLRFERGSVTFILALVPLFVLVLPLFVYLFLYCMGRSTIHQEPVELDVQFRRHDGPDPCFEIDMTFIGLHGVVLGAADQRVLNQEIDTLREELHWSLSPTG